MQKTQNLTSAVAVMLANSKVAANFLFEAMCGRTFAMDEDPATGQLFPRTLLNQSMMHLM